MASPSKRDNMMRIAIAGSGGLAQIFAHFLNETVHQFVILSRIVCVSNNFFETGLT
jgi:hypothetical protein